MAGAVVALDAMGGDHAPAEQIAAAQRAATEHGLRVLLVGDPDVISVNDMDGVQAVSAGGPVSMGDEAALAVRGNPDASVRVALRLVAQGRASACVSAGHTGATLAAALLDLGRIGGIRRPVVAAVIPAPRPVVLVDAGASPDVQPEALVTHARLGVAYAKVLGVPEPRIGLLSNGEEAGKGNALGRAAFHLLEGMEGFAGNVEPPAALLGAVDVLVTDGFTGNIMLKTLEGALALTGGSVGSPGAAALLGVRGTVLVAHGGARADELVAALVTAARLGRDLPARLAAAAR